MELNSNNRCRACLAENDAMLSLYEVYEHDLTLAMILQTCIATEVSENDGLPTHLCDSCILVLTQFYNFTVVYEESDKQLRKSFKKNKKCELINEPSELETTVDFVNGQTESIALEVNETDNVLNEIVAVEVSHEDVIANCNSSGEFEFYEYKNNGNNPNNQQQINNTTDYEESKVTALQLTVKKEIIMPEDLENIAGDHSEVAEPQVQDIVIKKEFPENVQYEQITKYECTICGESHLYASSFQQHMRIKHGMSDIACENYASRIQIKVHQKLNVESANSLSCRINMFNNDESQECKYCHKEFSSTRLQYHLKMHEGNRKYVCEVCGHRFIRKTYLDDHMEGHSTEKKHVCKFCGKAFRRRTVLRAHKRVHTHPNHYVCEYCGRAFTNSSTLKTHKLLIHIKERNFQCVICNLKFPLKSTLNKHVLRHQKRENGEKGFNCTQCDMQYRDKSSLKRHIDTKHQGRIQLVACGDCPKKYTSKANLIKHRRRHHSDLYK